MDVRPLETNMPEIPDDEIPGDPSFEWQPERQVVVRRCMNRTAAAMGAVADKWRVTLDEYFALDARIKACQSSGGQGWPMADVFELGRRLQVHIAILFVPAFHNQAKRPENEQEWTAMHDNIAREVRDVRTALDSIQSCFQNLVQNLSLWDPREQAMKVLAEWTGEYYEDDDSDPDRQHDDD